jgi:hypothetical protein
VEKILRRKRENGILKYFVKWVGYPNTNNSWVNATDVMRLS